jgi:hypothetical protein
MTVAPVLPEWDLNDREDADLEDESEFVDPPATPIPETDRSPNV